jgi:hypothetical protein
MQVLWGLTKKTSISKETTMAIDAEMQAAIDRAVADATLGLAETLRQCVHGFEDLQPHQWKLDAIEADLHGLAAHVAQLTALVERQVDHMAQVVDMLRMDRRRMDRMERDPRAAAAP